MISERFHCSRELVGWYRRAMGLPNRQRNLERWRKGFARALLRNGVRSLAEMRSLNYRVRAAAKGWPEDLTLREIEILEALERGAKTRKELAATLGMRWTKSRDCLKSNTSGSYTADLLRRGFIKMVYRDIPGRQGAHEAVYSINTQRRPLHYKALNVLPAHERNH